MFFASDTCFMPANIGAVFCVSLLSLGMGYLWYSPSLFGKMCMQDPSVKKGKKEECGCIKTCLIATLIMNLVTFWVLAGLLKATGQTSFTGGLQLGFWVWLGFNVPVELCGVIWEKKPIRKFLIDTGFNLLSFVFLGGVLSIWH